MTCAELRERLVDPASASLGGHAPVVEHLESCPACRLALRSYGAIERLFRTAAPPEPPPELDARVRVLFAEGATGLSRFMRSPRIAGGVVATALALVTLLLSRRSAPPTEAGPPAGTERAGPRAPSRSALDQSPPPDIVAVRSTPISLDTPPLSEEEKAQAAAVHDFEFLGMADALAALGPLFGESAPRSHAARAPHGTLPPADGDALEVRLLEWRRLTKAERGRLVQLDREFRGRPEAERVLLAQRWADVQELSVEERAGLRRLGARLAELDGKRLARLDGELVAIARAPRRERADRFRQNAFAKTLTGQELASAEKLLLSR